MVNIFSSGKKNNKRKVLQKQQINKDNITELLNRSAEALMCGPTCQKLKITEELKQKYLDAQTNLKVAPIQVEQTKKNYYIYTEGSSHYNDMLEGELKLKAENISVLLGENFNGEIAGALTMNTYLNTALINSSYTQELLKSYTDKNQEMKLLLKNRYGDILTNDRKTYYETDAVNNLQMWYKLWWSIYYLLVIVLVMAFVMTPSNLWVISKLIICVLVGGYPYYIEYIVGWIRGLFMSISKQIPKNVYNDL